jgi:hypothetical protein
MKTIVERIVPVIEQATQAAVQQAKVAVAGPDELTTPELLAMLEQYQQATQQVITQQAGLIDQHSTTIQQLTGALAAVQTALPSQITDALSAYNTGVVAPLLQQQAANTAGLSTLQGVVTSNATAMTTALATKATTTDLSALATTVGGKASTADLQALTSTVAGKALATDLTALTSTVNTKAAASDLTALTAVVGGKALASDLTATNSTLSALTTTVGGKASASDLSALTSVVGTKALASDLSTTNNTLTALTTTVGGKALASDLATTNSNVAANTTAIGLRATTASVTALQSTVTQNTADIATKATTAALNTEKGRIDGLLNTTVPALQADTALRLLRSGDTATGLIKGPDATVKTAYPTFQQTFGGINSPRRTIQNITTGTTTMVALTDTTGQNRTILPIGIQFLLTSSLNLLSTVTVKLGTTSGGSEIYTKTYSVLTGLVGKVTTIDQPTTATPLPAGQILYATVVGGGVWTVFFDAVFLPTAS